MANGFGYEADALETDEREYPDEFEFENDALGESPFDEAEVIDLAAEVLGVTDEAELEQFIGNLIQKAGQAVGKFVKSPTGRALGGILKGAAKKALPVVGSAVGSAIGGQSGAAIGGKLATSAGRIFGLELEGLSPEDQEFEAARHFVQFAGAAAKNAALASPATPPAVAAQAAAVGAARRLAPGLLRQSTPPTSGANATRGRSGRWIRHGRNIIVINI
jgi:hypothetical protein